MKTRWASFIQEHYIAIVTTHDNAWPQGVPIFYIFEKDENAFYFVSKSGTKKHANIQINNKASLTIYTETPPTVFTANCIAELSDFGSDKRVTIKNKLVEIHSTLDYYPSPLATLKDGVLTLVKLSVKSCSLKPYKKDIELLSA